MAILPPHFLTELLREYNQSMPTDTQTIETRIAAVTIFPDRARVTRTGRVSLATGIHSLEIVQLP